MLADSHVHLDRYPAAEVRAMLRKAADVGVEHLLTVGADRASSEAAITLAWRHSAVSAAVGVHPSRVAETPNPEAEMRTLARLATAPEVMAIGEVGLDDQHGGPEGLAAQRRFFEGCLDLARDRRLPLVLHVVGAHEDALRHLRPRAPLPAVVHYFVGDARLAERYLELGCLISVGKPVTRPAESALREAAAAIPLDRLLLETDTYPLPGRATEPRDVALVCAAVARVHRIEPAEVAARTTENFLRLFGADPVSRTRAEILLSC